MLARCLSASLLGIDAKPVTVEVDLAPGLPGLHLVGLADTAIQESRERVRSALRNSGFRGPLVKVVVNLAPADLRKEGPCFDLPIALGLLIASGQLDSPCLQDLWSAGELGLDGRLRPCRGILAIACLAKSQGARGLLVAAEDAAEASLVKGLKVTAAASLKDLVNLLRAGDLVQTPARPQHQTPRGPCAAAKRSAAPAPLNLPAQHLARQGLALAAAGGHHLLMVGPPGCGKTLLAQQLPGLLPPLDDAEALEITRLHSIAGLPGRREGLMRQRPFRAPHHSASAAALLGGGANPKPGELSLAHGGVLFLDELGEFPRAVLDQLRQPLEAGVLMLSRARVRCAFPCKVTLVAATNPCPCGWNGDSRCRCSESQVKRYWRRMSGPLLDRIDLQLRLEAPAADSLRQVIEERRGAIARETLHTTIEMARRQMQQRNPEGCSNRDLLPADLRRHGAFQSDTLTSWEQVMSVRRLSLRSGLKLLKVSRTIADLAGERDVTVEHLATALCFRSFDAQIQEGSAPVSHRAA